MKVAPRLFSARALASRVIPDIVLQSDAARMQRVMQVRLNPKSDDHPVAAAWIKLDRWMFCRHKLVLAEMLSSTSLQADEQRC